MFAEAESTVSRAQLQDDDGQSAKFSGTTEERGYRGGAGNVVDQYSRSSSLQLDHILITLPSSLPLCG